MRYAQEITANLKEIFRGGRTGKEPGARVDALYRQGCGGAIMSEATLATTDNNIRAPNHLMAQAERLATRQGRTADTFDGSAPNFAMFAFTQRSARDLIKNSLVPQTLTSISPLFKYFQTRKAEIPRLPCYTCA